MAQALRRLASAPPPAPLQVTVCDDGDGGPVLRVADDLRLRLGATGIAARYLAAVARRAAAAGWDAGEIGVLVGELDRRTLQWVTMSRAGRLPGGVRHRRSPFRPVAARWAGGRWRPAAADARIGDELVYGAPARHGVALAAVAGSGHPRWARHAIERWVASGARAGTLRGTSRGWVIEAVSAPRIGAPELSRLREVLAAAPRCGWCGTPVLGTLCRRCTPQDA